MSVRSLTIAGIRLLSDAAVMNQQSTHELMLVDTTHLLLEELRTAPSEDLFDKGYRQGMARALDLLKQQAEAFGIGERVGLSEFEYLDWVG